MRKLSALILILGCIVSFSGCFSVRKDETVSFQGKTISTAVLSDETLEWLEWYNGLSEKEQLAISYIPADLLGHIAGPADSSD